MRDITARRIALCGTLGIAIATGSAPTWAQSMDYQSLEQLFGEPVTTSATGSPQRTGDVPVNMVIVTADDIRRSGARDIPGVLRHVGGLDVLQWTNDHADVGIRGYAEPYTHRVLVLIDGRQVYTDTYGYTPWTTIPVELSAIRQIEIVKGPASALFGFNAVDGVINIVTYSPLYDDANTVSATAGTQDLVQGSLTSTFRIGDVAVRLTGGGFRDDDFFTPIPPTIAALGSPRTSGYRGAVDLRAIWKASERVHAELSASYNSSKTDELLPVYALNPTAFKASSVRGRVSADLHKAGMLQVSAYGNWFTLDYGSSPLTGAFLFKSGLAVVQAEDIFKVGSNDTFRISAEYRHIGLNTTPYQGGHVSQATFSVGGMWERKLGEKLTVTNAIRMDRVKLGRTGSVPVGYPFTNADWDRKFTELSFNSGVVWKPGHADTFRLAIGRATRVPSLAESGATLIMTPFLRNFARPTIDTSPTMSYELGWDHDLPSLQAELRASVFYTETHRIIDIQGAIISTPAGFAITGDNVGDSHAVGVEFGVRGKFGAEWRWGVDVRYESIKDKFRPGTQLIDFEHVTPKVIAKANLGWSRGPWDVDTFLHVQSDARGLEPTIFFGWTTVPLSSYAAVDGRIAYRVTDWMTLAISGQNLLQASQRQTSGPPIERRVLGTVTFAWR